MRASPLHQIPLATFFLASPLLCHGEEAQARYRDLPKLEATRETIHPLPLGFTSRSMLPWFGPDEPPAFLIGAYNAYNKNRIYLYRSEGSAEIEGALFAPPEGWPVYRGAPFNQIGAGRVIPIARDDGLFDLVRPGDWTYLVNTGKVGSPDFSKTYPIRFDSPPPKGMEWVADVDADGVPDVLIGAQAEGSPGNFSMYPDWPGYGHPWSGMEQPNTGLLPDTDMQNFRGYDIAGNWMGRPVRRELWWAPGRIVNGRLRFGTPVRVRYGETDYAVQWQSYGFELHPAAMELEGKPHIILFSDNDKAFGMPVRGNRGGFLHVGKSEPLLAGGGPLLSVNHPNVVGVGDLNGDGHDELVVGSGANGRLTILAGRRVGEFEEIGNVFHRGGFVGGDTLAVPVRKDWDGDGKPDIIIGDAGGTLSLRRGTDDPLLYDGYENFRTSEGFIRQRPTVGNLQGDNERAWSYTQPEVWDWNRDGRPDLFVNDNTARLFFYAGTDEPTRLASPQRLMMDGKPLPVAWRSRPAVLDAGYGITGDERDALLFVQWNEELGIAVPKEPGSLDFEQIIPVEYGAGGPVRFGAPAGLSGRQKLSVADWDGDGRWDILLGFQHAKQRFVRFVLPGSPSSAAFWLRNIGTNAKPVFDLPRMITFKDGVPIRVHTHDFNIYPTDLNGDGELDIIFGDDEGFIYYLMRDQLAWNESVEPEIEHRKNVQRRKDLSTTTQAGDVIFESLPDGKDTGWSGTWRLGKNANAGDAGSVITLKGDGKVLSSATRSLEVPVNFAPPEPVVLRFETTFRRVDQNNGGGQEMLTLLGLNDIDTGTRVLLVGMTSDEKLSLKGPGFDLESGPFNFRFGHPYRLEVILELNGEGPDMIRASLHEDSGAEGTDPVVTLEAEARISAVAGRVNLELRQFGGMLEVDSMRMAREL